MAESLLFPAVVFVACHGYLAAPHGSNREIRLGIRTQACAIAGALLVLNGEGQQVAFATDSLHRNRVSIASSMAEVAEKMGLPRDRILVREEARHTQSEAVALRRMAHENQLLGDEIVVVGAADHLRVIRDRWRRIGCRDMQFVSYEQVIDRYGDAEQQKIVTRIEESHLKPNMLRYQQLVGFISKFDRDYKVLGWGANRTRNDIGGSFLQTALNRLVPEIDVVLD